MGTDQLESIKRQFGEHLQIIYDLVCKIETESEDADKPVKHTEAIIIEVDIDLDRTRRILDYEFCELRRGSAFIGQLRRADDDRIWVTLMRAPDLERKSYDEFWRLVDAFGPG